MRELRMMCGALAVAVCLAPSARADERNKLTYLTFSGPVQVPGHTLPAGTYMFKLADSLSNRHIVQIFDKDGTKIFATILAIPEQRLEPSDKPVVMFRETPAGAPAAIRAWFYPGNTIGDEFVYPRQQAMAIARATHEPVLSMADSTTTASDMKGAEVSRIDEGGKATETRTTGTTGTTANQSTASRPAAPSVIAQSGGTTASAATPRRARRLPRTASALPLYELISGLAFVGACAARRLRM